MCRNLYSVTVLLLMSTFTITSNDPICDFILSEGKLRALGLHRRFDINGKPSYWLFRRDTSNAVVYDFEYELSFGADWKLNVSPKRVDTTRANQKFSLRFENENYNCSLVRNLTSCSLIGPIKKTKIIDDRLSDFWNYSQWIVVQPLLTTNLDIDSVFVFKRDNKKCYFVQFEDLYRQVPDVCINRTSFPPLFPEKDRTVTLQYTYGGIGC